MAFARLSGATTILFQFARGSRLRQKYRDFTMVPQGSFWKNIAIAEKATRVAGCVVECGTWRGGMLAGIAETMGKDRRYIGFDSFAGLPPAKLSIDGPDAIRYQGNVEGEWYFNNCTANQSDAEMALAMSGARRVDFVVGWFEDTVPRWTAPEPIALLRLDGDWYDSTMVCLDHLVPQLAPGGYVIIDDYYAWGGCAKAVHQWLARAGIPIRLRQLHNDVCYYVMPDSNDSMIPTSHTTD